MYYLDVFFAKFKFLTSSHMFNPLQTTEKNTAKLLTCRPLPLNDLYFDPSPSVCKSSPGTTQRPQLDWTKIMKTRK